MFYALTACCRCGKDHPRLINNTLKFLLLLHPTRLHPAIR